MRGLTYRFCLCVLGCCCLCCCYLQQVAGTQPRAVLMATAAGAAAVAASAVLQASSAVEMLQLAAVAQNLLANAVVPLAVGQALLVVLATAVALLGAQETAAQAAAAVLLEGSVAPLAGMDVVRQLRPAALAPAVQQEARAALEMFVVALQRHVAGLNAATPVMFAVQGPAAHRQKYVVAVVEAAATLRCPRQSRAQLIWMPDITLITPLPRQG